MNKKILIVGASSGLGKRLAQLYAAEGCEVGIVARRDTLLTEIQQQYPSNIKTLAADISRDDIETRITQFIGSMNGIDLAIITASVFEFTREFPGIPELNTVAVNITGFTRVINAVWHHFHKKGVGQLAVVTSVAAARGNKHAPAYSASKAFQSTYADGLRLKSKYEKNHITVTELTPGYIDTEMAVGDRIFWMVSVDKAARLAKRAIEKKKRRVFIPKRWWWIFHIMRIMPTFISDAVLNGSWKLKRRT